MQLRWSCWGRPSQSFRPPRYRRWWGATSHLGVFVFADQIALDYRIGPDWRSIELRAFFRLLLDLARLDHESSVTLEPPVLPVVAEHFQTCWSRFVSEDAPNHRQHRRRPVKFAVEDHHPFSPGIIGCAVLPHGPSVCDRLKRLDVTGLASCARKRIVVAENSASYSLPWLHPFRRTADAARGAATIRGGWRGSRTLSCQVENESSTEAWPRVFSRKSLHADDLQAESCQQQARRSVPRTGRT